MFSECVCVCVQKSGRVFKGNLVTGIEKSILNESGFTKKMKHLRFLTLLWAMLLLSTGTTLSSKGVPQFLICLLYWLQFLCRSLLFCLLVLVHVLYSPSVKPSDVFKILCQATFCLNYTANLQYKYTILWCGKGNNIETTTNMIHK